MSQASAAGVDLCKHKTSSQLFTGVQVQIIHRYHFFAALKRMSTIVSVDQNSQLSYYCLVKGAPETIFEFLCNVGYCFRSWCLMFFCSRRKTIIKYSSTTPARAAGFWLSHKSQSQKQASQIFVRKLVMKWRATSLFVDFLCILVPSSQSRKLRLRLCGLHLTQYSCWRSTRR